MQIKIDSARQKILIGFAGGVLVTLVGWGVFSLAHPDRQPDVIAQMHGMELTYDALRQKAANDLTPVENDEYAILEHHLNEWVLASLLDQEAQDQGIDPTQVLRDSVWSQVEVSENDVMRYYKDYRRTLE